MSLEHTSRPDGGLSGAIVGWTEHLASETINVSRWPTDREGATGPNGTNGLFSEKGGASTINSASRFLIRGYARRRLVGGAGSWTIHTNQGSGGATHETIVDATAAGTGGELIIVPWGLSKVYELGFSTRRDTGTPADDLILFWKAWNLLE